MCSLSVSLPISACTAAVLSSACAVHNRHAASLCAGFGPSVAMHLQACTPEESCNVSHLAIHTVSAFMLGQDVCSPQGGTLATRCISKGNLRVHAHLCAAQRSELCAQLPVLPRHERQQLRPRLAQGQLLPCRLQGLEQRRLASLVRQQHRRAH